MINALNAERIKFLTTRGWIFGTFAFVALAFLLPVANAMTGNDPVRADGSYGGVLGFAMIAAMVVGATLVTQEYRYRMVLVSHQAAPKRWQPLASKAVLAAIYGAVMSALMTVVVALVVNLMVASNRRADFDPAAQAGAIATTALTVALMCVFAVGLGALVRSTSAAVALVVLWQTPIELVLGMLPGIGKQLQPYLLFNNTMVAAVGQTPGGVQLHWGQAGALLYLAAIAAVAMVLGLWRTHRPVAD